jgi:DNA-binding HxlR family transcriptional regulator
MGSAPKKYKYDWPIDAILAFIEWKWKPLIVYALNDEALRFSQ